MTVLSALGTALSVLAYLVVIVVGLYATAVGYWDTSRGLRWVGWGLLALPVLRVVIWWVR